MISSNCTSIPDLTPGVFTVSFIFSFVVSQEERDLVAKGRYDALIEHQKKTDSAIEEEV